MFDAIYLFVLFGNVLLAAWNWNNKDHIAAGFNAAVAAVMLAVF